MIAVIIGSTGLVGHTLLKKLLQEPRFAKVISVSRGKTGLVDAKLIEILVSDLRELSAHGEHMKGDLYFCCLGTTIKNAGGSRDNFRKVDFQAVVDFGKIAKSHEAQSFVLISAAGANADSSIFYNRVKGEAEVALANLGLKHLVIFRPGLLLGDRPEFRAAEKVFIKIVGCLKPILPTSIKRRATTDVIQLATRMMGKGLETHQGTIYVEAKDI